jgi:hypothetical protein
LSVGPGFIAWVRLAPENGQVGASFMEVLRMGFEGVRSSPDDAGLMKIDPTDKITTHNRENR